MKAVAIDELARWAYRVELPKEPIARKNARYLRQASHMAGWVALSKSAELGTEVDEPDARNRFGLAPDTLATNEPHPDAVRLFQAVQSMDGMLVELPDEWDPLSDVRAVVDDTFTVAAARTAGIERIFYHAQPHVTVTLAREGMTAEATTRVTKPLPEEHRRLGLRRSVPDLIQVRAVLGGTPPWETPLPQKKAQRHPNGQPRWFMRVGGVDVDGYDHKAHRPFQSAFQKFYYDPDLAGIVEARAEYWLWHEALTQLAALLRPMLDAHTILPPSVPATPWATPGVRAPRTFVTA